MKEIKVLLVEDHPLIRKAWKFLLNQDPRFHVVADCETGEDAIELVAILQPEIIIIDMNLKGITALETTEKIIELYPGTKIIGLSYHVLPEYAWKMIQQGAMGYLTRCSPPAEIYKTILEVYEGNFYICKEMSDCLNDQ
jgi:DNA-binding NarL/FixJ family response regulator